MTEATEDRILGVLYGQAIGDAMGMPSELWPLQTIRSYFGGRITEFLDGPKSNDIALNFTKGQYTDDTNQALVILDALIETNWVPDQQVLVKHIMKWADDIGAWTNNILGPSSKAALLAIRDGKDPKPVTDKALTNGCAMRIAPIGTLFDPQHEDELIKMVYEVTRVTHSSDVAVSGAAMVAAMVTAGLADYSWDDMITFAINVQDKAFKLGAPTWAASNRERLRVGLQLAKTYANDEDAFAKAIYETVGTGTPISESIPAAVAVAYYTKNVEKCALMCANLGGDTDTIGAMATAICGSKQGHKGINSDWLHTIDTKNPEHDIKSYVPQIESFRRHNGSKDLA